jgi:Glycosyl transferase family 2
MIRALASALKAVPLFIGLEWRDRAAGRQLRLVQDRRDRIRPKDILLVTCLRNELARMPAFVAHYRALGVGHFLVVDNGSTDGFPDWAAGQPDVSVWYTEASYRDSHFGILWCNDLLRRHAHNRWCVVVDPDEFLVFPNMETRGLKALTQFLEDDKRPCLHALLIDAYSDRPLADTTLASGEDPFAACGFFDRDGYVQTPGWGNGTWIQGGPRLRKYFHDRPAEAPALNKIPLIRWKRPYHYRQSTHDAYPRRLNRAHAIGEVSATGALFHFKLVAALQAKAVEEAGRNEHYAGGREYARYRLAGEAEFFDPGISTRYDGSEQLVRLGLISAGRWF